LTGVPGNQRENLTTKKKLKIVIKLFTKNGYGENQFFPSQADKPVQKRRR
jgi:hypothetical protein